MMWKLFLDDERIPEKKHGDHQWTIARSSDEAIRLVEERGCPIFISFDHDLGGDDTSMVFLKWLTDKVLDGEIFMPDDFSYQVHSANIVGSKNICAFLNSFLRVRNG